MNSRSFSLQPFSSATSLSGLTITGYISRHRNELSIRYVLSGSAAGLVIPEPADVPVRKSGLWEETCLELFLAVKGSPGYWELNLSPAGHWNVYRFSAYRQGMQEETAFASLPFCVRRQSDSLLLVLSFVLESIIPADQVLEVGISAVTKYRNDEAAYWALVHRGPQADFHRRDSFIVEL